ncbi:hypothetical protein [Chryseolinea lacunae]|uniref:PepSY domain-containing protein n=1 Tax=Chryseolinea lacunae TaxID=2801331 RepID=A0ABS1KUS8_9BACT|nr:hypothetical protein [Chryseolinea lacunae]MBL0742948.1 hypothetical protein [Chryseolinea lacunae]
MKNIFIFLAGMFLVSMTAQAQVEPDTLSNVREGNPQVVAPKLVQDQGYTKDMIRVKAADIPAAVQLALKGNEYNGWEDASLFKSKSGDVYRIEMKDGDMTKTYRFDRRGKRIKE